MDCNTLLDPGFDLHWQMGNTDRLAMLHILASIKPMLALEIGTYRGGSLQAIAKWSKRVISIDANAEVSRTLGPRFKNVTFLTGDSHQLLPSLVEQFNETRQAPGFVLIDGDHSTDGVRADIEALLRVKPTCDLVMLLHDSFNPACRLGMTTSKWGSSPYVHAVEIDFIPGGFTPKAVDTAAARSMWGGLACAILKPFPRQGALIVHESQQAVFEAVKPISIHAQEQRSSSSPFPIRFYRRSRVLAGRLKRRLLGQPIP